MPVWHERQREAWASNSMPSGDFLAGHPQFQVIEATTIYALDVGHLPSRPRGQPADQRLEGQDSRSHCSVETGPRPAEPNATRAPTKTDSWCDFPNFRSATSRTTGWPSRNRPMTRIEENRWFLPRTRSATSRTASISWAGVWLTLLSIRPLSLDVLMSRCAETVVLAAIASSQLPDIIEVCKNGDQSTP